MTAVLLLFFGMGRASALSVNYWPFFVGERKDGEAPFHRWQAVGPLVFQSDDTNRESRGVRPFYVFFEEKERPRDQLHILYPIFNWRWDDESSAWDIFNIVTFSRFSPEGGEDSTRSFNFFPIIFSRQSPDPDRSYFGVFPIAGSVRNFFGYDRISWYPFPFVRLERRDIVTVGMPWPFLRFVHGAAEGFHLWPLYGRVRMEGRFDRRYFLWPLVYHIRQEVPNQEPFKALGVLPFYTRSSSSQAVSENFLWPFFGYTNSFQPEYREIRYFWPLLIQRRGASYINRWMPFYSRSIRAGVDRRWYMWPLLRREEWEERGLHHEKTQVLYFLYSSLEQSVPNAPDIAPAVRRHLWPLYSLWDDGAGRRQFQIFSPFEIFFPHNEVIRAKYSPIFAIYRYDRVENARVNHSLLWGLAAWGREESISHLNIGGPIFRYSSCDYRREISIGRGLLGYARSGDRRSYRLLWFHLPRRREQESIQQ